MGKTKAIMAEFARVKATKDGKSVKLAPTNGTTDDGNGFAFEHDGRTVRVFPLVYVEGDDAEGIELEIGIKGLSFGKQAGGKATEGDRAAILADLKAAGFSAAEAIAAMKAL